jgi:CheY-like chemotaxis protein
MDLLAAGASAHAAAIHLELSSLADESASLGHPTILALARQAEAAARQIPHDPAAVVCCMRTVRALIHTLGALEAGRAATEPSEPPADASAQEDVRGRVLLVDDSKVSAYLLSTMLSEEGFAVEIAGNEPELERALAAFRPDLALSDVNMPGFDCAVVCRRVKEVAPRARVVLFSGLAERALASACERAHADGYVSRDRGPAAVVERVIAELSGTGR